MFTPALKIGSKITNAEIAKAFDCSLVGNMRQSKENECLILISDFTKGEHHDKWIQNVLHFTGYGKKGDQDIHRGQNATLCDSKRFGTAVFLFQMLEPGFYTYAGRVELDDKPYVDMQEGEDHKERMIWVFPLRPVTEEEIEKPSAFVFDSIAEYEVRHAAVEAEYAEVQKTFKKPSAAATARPIPVYVPKVKKLLEIPADIVGKEIQHKKYGHGIVKEILGSNIACTFDTLGEKKLGYTVCIEKNLIQVL